MLFGPHQNPRAMLTCKLTSDLVRSIMVTHALVEIICVTDIETVPLDFGEYKPKTSRTCLQR